MKFAMTGISNIDENGDGFEGFSTTVPETLAVKFCVVSLRMAPDVVINVPTLSEWGLIAIAAILGIVGFMVLRRRKVSA
ncbi:MAG: IPTL-CTERM sorting domain-containing protein [Candidatus Dadabacteria bacterium]|nr:IPTL-CTERM sorting domain-containing protein [Candidatus Dadabacteria bacterium]